MPRWFSYTDEERLPEGMTRVGYDSDTQVYTFRDADGSYWESAPGNMYGVLQRVSGGNADSASTAFTPFLGGAEEAIAHKKGQPSWRAEMMPLFNFFALVGVSFLALIYFLSRFPGGPGTREHVSTNMPASRTCPEGSLPHVVAKGDTCWGISQTGGVRLGDLVDVNDGVLCDSLEPNQTLCVQAS